MCMGVCFCVWCFGHYQQWRAVFFFVLEKIVIKPGSVVEYLASDLQVFVIAFVARMNCLLELKIQLHH